MYRKLQHKIKINNTKKGSAFAFTYVYQDGRELTESQSVMWSQPVALPSVTETSPQAKLSHARTDMGRVQIWASKERRRRESLKRTVRCCTRPAPPAVPPWSLLLAHIKAQNNRDVDRPRQSDVAAGCLAICGRAAGCKASRLPYPTPGVLYFTPSPKSSSSVS